MSKVTLTPVQRDAFRQIAGTGVAKDAKEATIKALLRRNLIAPDGDGFALTKAGLAFRALDVKEIAAAAAEKNGTAKSTPKPKSLAAKKAEKLAEDKAKREAKADPAAGMNAVLAGTGIRVEFEPNVPGEVETDAPVVEPKAAPKTERLTKVTTPKAPAKPKADKDSTIRVAKQIRTFIDGHAVKTDPLAKRIATADLAKDESVRISISDAELDVLRGWAVAMADGSTTGRGDVRSARALIQWIDGMKARRASKK